MSLCRGPARAGQALGNSGGTGFGRARGAEREKIALQEAEAFLEGLTAKELKL